MLPVAAVVTAMTPEWSQLPQETSSAKQEGDEIAVGDFLLWKQKIKLFNLCFITLVHILALIAPFVSPLSATDILWHVYVAGLAGFGITAGVHRYWTHRAYKAKMPLRIILVFCYGIAGQKKVYDWVRDHRVHHKYSDTDADPHNSKRGLLFSHVGWLVMKKHPEVIRKGRQIDMSDILEDRIATFFDTYFFTISTLCCFVLPSVVPCYLWGTKWYDALMHSMLRYALQLNITWTVNSLAHALGSRPYDKRHCAAENKTVAFLAMGEGWHNYHHVFPWDYKAAELGNYSLNLTTFYLDLFAKIGWAYDLKHPSKEIVRKVAEKYGDGSHPQFQGHMPEVKEEEDPNMTILYPSTDKNNSNSRRRGVAVTNGIKLQSAKS